MYSPDGRWWWNGLEWIPAPQWRTRFELTPWTRKLQIAVLSLQVLALVFAAVTFPTIYNIALTGTMTSSPALANDPQTADALRQILAAVIVLTVIFTVVVLVVMVVGVLKLWRWLYWYLMITYGIAIIAIPANLLSAFGYNAYGNAAIRYPDWYYVISTLLVLVEVGLCVWMIIAYRRYGNWARRKIVEPA